MISCITYSNLGESFLSFHLMEIDEIRGGSGAGYLPLRTLTLSFSILSWLLTLFGDSKQSE